jgi:hypothetical protein
MAVTWNHRDRYLENSRQRKLKLRWDTSIGYKSWKLTHACQGGLLGGHKRAPVRHNKHAIPPACSSPLCNNWRSAWLGRSWCLLLITSLAALGWAKAKQYGTSSEASATKRATACYQPVQATWCAMPNTYVCWSVLEKLSEWNLNSSTQFQSSPLENEYK